MTIKEKFDNIEIMFENQVASLKYDELSEASNHCEKIADEFAIGFLNWYAMHGSWIEENLTTKELLEIYKKEKGL
jgi:hypothetical protein